MARLDSNGDLSYRFKISVPPSFDASRRVAASGKVRRVRDDFSLRAAAIIASFVAKQ